MKKFRIFLSAIAMTVAIAGAFASEFAVAETGYKFVSGGSPECQPSITCNGGSFMCKSGSDQLWRLQTGGTCQTTQLQHDSAF